MGYLPAGCLQPLPPARRLIVAGGPGPAMSAHLAMPPYLPYPGAVRYGDYYWLSPGSMDSVPAEEAPAADALPFPAAEKTPSHPGTRPGPGAIGRAIGLPSAEGWLCPLCPSCPGDGGRCRCCRRPPAPARVRRALLRRLPRWKWRREPGPAASGPCAQTGRDRVRAERGLGSAAPRVSVPTSPRCVARGCGAPASPQGTRNLKFSREAGLRSLLSLLHLTLLTPVLSFLLRCISGFFQLWDTHPVHPRLCH